MVRAYELEQGVAKYPRIIVSEPVRKAVWGYHTGIWKGHLLRCDIDGCWFVNVLTPSASNWMALPPGSGNASAGTFLNKLRPVLASEVARYSDENRLSKWTWLVHWFNHEAAREQGVTTIDLSR